jgi:hypothetical protein
MVSSHRSGTAHGKPWSNSELVIAVYFSSRCICTKALFELLSRRGYQRTERAIERKVHDIVNSAPSLRPNGQWDVDAVDRWIDDILDHDAVNRLTAFTPEDATVVALVSTTPNISPIISYLPVVLTPY